MATITYYISASYIGGGLQDTSFLLFHTECGKAANVITYSGSQTITSQSLAQGLALTLDESITTLYLSPISADCPLGCGYQYSINLALPATATPTPTPTGTPVPTGTPTPTDTPEPTPGPTLEPTIEPTTAPTLAPGEPTLAPTIAPTLAPTAEPTIAPTVAPTIAPTTPPTLTPTPTARPTSTPLPPTSTPLPCVNYEIENTSFDTLVKYRYVTCAGVWTTLLTVPPSYKTPKFCAQVGTIVVEEGEAFSEIYTYDSCTT